MGDCPDVLDVVEGLPLFVSGEAPDWLSRVDPFKDAKAAKILERYLEQLEAL